MSRGCPAATDTERGDDALVPASILRALEREAAHLTRRDGRRRHVVRWGDDPPAVEAIMDEDRPGLSILASIDLA